MRRPFAVVIILCAAPALHAGMPVVRLDELAEARFQTISFFLVVLLICATIVRWLWNSLAQDLPKLPRLNYRRALAMTALWGLAAMVVLTMISGARELMTPGAWERRGATHALIDSVDPRRQRIEAWRDALWAWSDAHGGAFPPHELAAELPPEASRTLHASGAGFVYVGGRARDSDAILSYEPGVYAGKRWTIFADGRIEQLPIAQIHDGRAGKVAP
ncbi:MAG TPA: hypothetical protein VEL07_01845 [Planctomycetota bacterium]|nr:hypothetical protein [Planctomycetota bacterium]